MVLLSLDFTEVLRDYSVHIFTEPVLKRILNVPAIIGDIFGLEGTSGSWWVPSQ
ncbi:hypothetical protein GN244_ATG13142 [Phytophthora infestans]|uniref:Uncharacterized protein n=1 Tax=Phytophthora infestans TaxID=4787 RepID=A0A833T749_PHYIN|nr:hypothetical protein GN244_ATG13142 [Phytophthora infestans]KAF4132717.1 hypothetical protein GN958_ATG18096 [Phytophthora infestans]